jgi:5'-phosphate synthase pdxT subunit
MNVGVLALQGCIEPHCRMLESIGATPVKVRRPSELESIDRLIMPGGESTTMLRFLERQNMFSALRDFCRTHPVWGICAGSILLAKQVENPSQPSLELAPVRAVRNFYGSQLDSFKTTLPVEPLGRAMEVDFIRAPLLEALTPEVQILARYESQQVLLRYQNILLSSFHVELGEDAGLHQYFLSW